LTARDVTNADIHERREQLRHRLRKAALGQEPVDARGSFFTRP